MRIPILLLTLLVAVAGAHAQSQSSAWRVYTVKDESFSVALPNHPSMHTAKEKRQKPEKDRLRRVLGASNNGIAYTVYVVENPKSQQSLESFIKEQTSSLELAAASDPTLNGVTGKAFVYSDGKGMVQFFATGDRLYEFRAHGASLDDARMTTFFSSLSLKRQDKSIDVFDGPGSFSENVPQDMHNAGDVDSKIRLEAKPEPSYTPQAESDKVIGTVILRCIFTSQGTVTNIKVIKGLPGGLTEKAIEAARQIKFVPATKNGMAVSMWMQLEYNFDIFKYR